MSAPDVPYGMLTALFAAAALRGLRQGVQSPRSAWCSRIDHHLHAVMALAMTAMPWGSPPCAATSPGGPRSPGGCPTR
jgi:hypothetical protein